MENSDFHAEADVLFESYLGDNEVPRIVIYDNKNNKVLKINYDLVLFDNNLNIYKKENGTIEKVNNPDFKAVVIRSS